MNPDEIDPEAAEWQALRNLFHAYLHQDFADDHGSAPEAVEAWRDEHDPTQLDAAVREIDRLLDGLPDEDSLRRAVRILDANYRPTDDGLTYRQWLSDVRAVFVAGLGSMP